MTTIDLHIARPARVTRDRATLAAALTALALVLLMGVPALMAPPSQIAADGWHGNSASSARLR